MICQILFLFHSPHLRGTEKHLAVQMTKLEPDGKHHRVQNLVHRFEQLDQTQANSGVSIFPGVDVPMHESNVLRHTGP